MLYKKNVTGQFYVYILSVGPGSSHGERLTIKDVC